MVFALFLTGCPETDEAECGNLIIESGESCDDGNTQDGDGCSSSCQFEGFCGNSVQEPGEECDDGNYNNGDGCDDHCQKEDGCGNGILEVGEQCDDDNLIAGDGCSGTCIDEDGTATCGNDIWEANEGCEDGNTDDGDGCSSTCQREDGCGNGVVEGTEECDDGNNVSGDGCLYDCRQEFFCGDDICDEDNNEACEYCPRDCCPDCGNGRLDSGESCDDGNNESDDGCSAGCMDEDGTATCGNGIWESGEQCDDGNTDANDGCSATCQLEGDCGDGLCDPTMHESCILCPQDCCPNCDNGSIDAGEQCDDTDFGGLTCEDFGLTSGSLHCTTSCQIDTSGCTGTGPQCGNSTAEYGEMCDDTDLRSQTCITLGYASGNLACSGTCAWDVGSCSGRQWFLFEDFEESGTPAGWVANESWEVGTPSSVGPAAAHGGTRCAGTRIAAIYDNGMAYLDDYLETPLVDLTTASDPRMRFYTWLQSQSQVDGGNLWVSEDYGLSWHVMPTTTLSLDYQWDLVAGHPAWTGDFATMGWYPVIVDLSAFAGKVVAFRFAFASDTTTNDGAGMYVDDVIITEAADLPVELASPSPLPAAVLGYAYSYQMRAIGGSGNYEWSITGRQGLAWLDINTSTGALSGTPDATSVAMQTVTIRVQESGSATNFDEQTFDLDVLSAIFFDDFETGDASGWGLGTPLPIWEHGVPSSVGPTTAHSGTQCIGTGIAANYDATFCMMTGCAGSSPEIDLTHATAPVLTFYQWIDTAAADGVYLGIVVDGGAAQTITAVDPPYNAVIPGMPPIIPDQPVWQGDLSAQGWHLVTVDLTPYVGSVIELQFTLTGQSMGSDPGWYVDTVLVAD